MPGATAVHYPIAEVDGRPDARRFNSKAFVGGVHLNRKVGLFALDFEDASFPNQPHSLLTAKKSWFFFGDRIIALGSDIDRSADANAHMVETTLFQTKLNGSNAPANTGDVNWLVDTAGHGYYVPKGQNVTMFESVQQSRSHGDASSTEGTYRTAVINHGVSPEGESYEYLVCPNGADFDDARVTELASSYKIVRQDDEAHVVEDLESGVTGAVLFAPLSEPIGVLASVDVPALIVLQAKEGGRLSLSVANPDLGLLEANERASFTDLLNKDLVRNDSRVLPVRVALDGEWTISETSEGAKIVSAAKGRTVIEFQCQHGMGIQSDLKTVR
jgi:chondroitin-sulfate-ABC endolyase/exolyase